MNYTLAQWLEWLAKKQPEDFHIADYGMCIAINQNGEWQKMIAATEDNITSDSCDEIAARIGKGYVLQVHIHIYKVPTDHGTVNRYEISGQWHYECKRLVIDPAYTECITDVPPLSRQAAIDTLIEIIRHEYGEPEVE